MSSFDLLILTSLNKLAVRTSSNSVLRIVHVGEKGIFSFISVKLMLCMAADVPGFTARYFETNALEHLLENIGGHLPTEPSLPSVQ